MGPFSMINVSKLPEFFTSHFAEINGHKLAYLDEGPSKAPVLVLAALWGTGSGINALMLGVEW